MIYFSTDSTAHNTSAPADDRGWQWVGAWDTDVAPHTYTGVPIGPHHFVAAKHVGGVAGVHALTLNGIAYTTVRSFNHPNSEVDLRIWEVREAFPTWAQRFPTGRNEQHLSTSVFGRGKTRGDPVHVDGTTTLRGWQWGGSTGTLRWGSNVVTGIAYDDTPNPAGSGNRYLLYSLFDSGGGQHECHLAIGDSSGPVFIQHNGTWMLAGVAVIVDGGFHTTASGSRFAAAIFNKDGLFQNGTLVPDDGFPSPSGFYAERLSAYATWIDSVLASPLRASISLSDLRYTYDGAPHAATVSTSPAGLATSVTYNGSATAPTAAGSYEVVATITASGYEPTTATGTLVIAKAAQTITFPAPPGATYGDAPVTLTASASSGLPVTFASNAPTAVTISGSHAIVVGAGSATITASQVGDSNHLAAPDVSRALEVSRAPQTIAFATLDARTVGDDPFTLTATATSGLPVTFASDNTGVATISGNQVTLVGAGEATITATQAGNTNYDAAASVSRVLTVNAPSSSGSTSHAVPAAPAWALFGAGVLFFLVLHAADRRPRRI